MAWFKDTLALVGATLFCGMIWLWGYALSPDDYIEAELYHGLELQIVDAAELYEAQAAALAGAQAAETKAFQTYMENAK